jgi:hypothetical protein
MNAEFQKQLKKAQQTWGSAKEKAKVSGYGDEFEDGRYKVTITRADLGTSRSSNRLQVVFGYTFVEGDYTGKTKLDYDGCDTEDNQVWLGRKLTRLGYEVPDDITELEDTLKQILKDRIVVCITLKTKGEFQKVYIDRVMSGDEASAEMSEIAPAAEAPAGEEAELTAGMKVSFVLKGNDVEGEVVEVLEATEEARVKTDDGKVYRLKVEKLTLIEETPTEPTSEEEAIPEEPASEEEAPAKVTKKKPALKSSIKRQK